MQIDITNMKNAVYVVGGTYAKDFVLDPNPDATPPQYAPVDVYHVASACTFVLPSRLSIRGKHADHHARRCRARSSARTSRPTRPLSMFSTTTPAALSGSRATRGSGNQIVVQGEAQMPILAYVTDHNSIATYGYPRGCNQRLDQILSVQEAQERAQADIDMFGDPVYTVKFNTISPLTNQLSIGQQITLNSAKFGVSNKLLIIKQINFVARTPTQLEAQVQCLGSAALPTTTSCSPSCSRTSAQESTPASTVLQDLIPIDEEYRDHDAVTIIGASRPYVWGPIPSPLQYPEGGATYGSFGYGSTAYAGGLPYADDAPIANNSPEAVWSFFTWS